jgi:hypothetical protein
MKEIDNRPVASLSSELTPDWGEERLFYLYLIEAGNHRDKRSKKMSIPMATRKRPEIG